MADFDFFVIGAGSGGVRASRIAAQLGAKVAVAEERYLGGTCVNVGCVPKKLFVYGSHFNELFAQARDYGWKMGEAHLDWQQLRERKDTEITRLNGVYRRLLENAGVTLFEQHARLLGPNRVQVGEREITADKILLAVGGWPFIPQVPGGEHVISSNEVFALDELPESIAIVGGGYIAVEFASIFQGMGLDTHLIYRGECFLRGFDADVRQHMVEQMQKKGVHLHFNTDVAAISLQPNGMRELQLSNGASLSCGQVMYATGRKPKLDGLGLENTRVQVNDKGAVVVDEQFQTREPSIYAVGDIIDGLALTPVALAQGMSLARQLFGEVSPAPLDYTKVPTAVFTQPAIATVGLTEEQARERGGKLRIYRSVFTPLALTLTQSSEKALVKLIVDADSDEILGCHVVGPEAGEIIQGFAVAIGMGATKADFDRTLGVHPTLAEELVTLREPVSG